MGGVSSSPPRYLPRCPWAHWPRSNLPGTFWATATQKPSFKQPQTAVKPLLFSQRWKTGSPSDTSERQTSQSLGSPRADASFWAKANQMLNAGISQRRGWILASYFGNYQGTGGAAYQHSAFYGIRHPSHEKRQWLSFLNSSFKDLLKSFLLLHLHVMGFLTSWPISE